MAEIEGRPVSIIDELRRGDPGQRQPRPLTPGEMQDRVDQGGMPGGLSLDREARIERFRSYPDRSLGPEMVGARRHTLMMRLLNHLFQQSPVMENVAELSRSLEMVRDAVLAHLDVLEESFLVWRQPGFSPTGSGGVRQYVLAKVGCHTSTAMTILLYGWNEDDDCV